MASFWCGKCHITFDTAKEFVDHPCFKRPSEGGEKVHGIDGLEKLKK